MKVAFVTQPWDELVPETQYSSIPIIAYQLARRLVRSCDVIIYAKRGQSHSKVERDANGVQIRRVGGDIEQKMLGPARAAYRLTGFRNPTRPYYGRTWYHLGYFLKVANDLRKQQCDIVHVFNFSQFVPLVRSLNPKIKIVLHMECEWLTQLDPTLIGPRLDKADLVIGCSRFITEKIRNRFPNGADKYQTIHNAVDPDKFSCKDLRANANTGELKRLLYVGRLSPEKGVHVLLEAFELIAQRYPSIQIDIVGAPGEAPVEFTILGSDDEKTSELRSFYSSGARAGTGMYFSYLQNQLPPDVTEQIYFRGNVMQSELKAYYDTADVFVFPSVWNEPFGIPLVEAMACYIPVVATHSGGMTEIVEDGKTGLLVERGDAKALAEAVLTLITDDELRESMGKAGRQRMIEYFTWDRMAEKLLHQYEQIASIES